MLCWPFPSFCFGLRIGWFPLNVYETILILAMIWFSAVRPMLEAGISFHFVNILFHQGNSGFKASNMNSGKDNAAATGGGPAVICIGT